jgi:hypothetical protein
MTCDDDAVVTAGRPEPIERYLDLIGINVERRHVWHALRVPRSGSLIGTNIRLRVS